MNGYAAVTFPIVRTWSLVGLTVSILSYVSSGDWRREMNKRKEEKEGKEKVLTGKHISMFRIPYTNSRLI